MMQNDIALYIGVSIGAGVFLCIVIIIAIFIYKRRVIHRSASTSRRLFIRGFSTISQRGVLDSTAEFEITNMMSVSSEDAVNRQSRNQSTKSTSAPKKPQRKKTRTSSSNPPKYENVNIEPSGDFVFERSSASSNIPYMDTTLESRISRDDDFDDVFES